MNRTSGPFGRFYGNSKKNKDNVKGSVGQVSKRTMQGSAREGSMKNIRRGIAPVLCLTSSFLLILLAITIKRPNSPEVRFILRGRAPQGVHFGSQKSPVWMFFASLKSLEAVNQNKSLTKKIIKDIPPLTLNLKYLIPKVKVFV